MRQSWKDYFLDLAKKVATRSTCDRLNVGAIITKDNRIVSTGYNGSLPGCSHCSETGHDMVNGSCIRTVHAEVNAIATAARMGISVDMATMYLTHLPCFNCFKVISTSGIAKVVCGNDYKKERFESVTKNYLKDMGGIFISKTRTIILRREK